ncbi:MAG: extracellular solute-binding protein [Chloroflexaceae bacterium]|nr:extracellular solute-binding protein [Chloroflexaceae bacterium]
MAVPQQLRRIVILALTLLILTACSAQGGSLSTTPQLPTPAPARTILLLWHAWAPPADRALAVVVERFNRGNPGMQVVIQTRQVTSLRDDLASAVAEGAGPHMAIVPSHTLGGLVEEGVLLPLDGLLTTQELERLLPVAVGAVQVRHREGARLYGVPLTFDTLALYYNKANFSAAPPGDTDSLLRVARGLSDNRSDPPVWGLAYNLNLDRTIPYLYAFGGRIFDDQGNLVLGLDGRAGTEAWLEWLLVLREDEGLLASLDGITVDNALMSQRALMTMDWAHAVGRYGALWPGNLGVAPLPRLSETNRLPQPYVQSDTLVLNARLGDGPERAAAIAFTRHLVSEASQRELLRAGRQPVLMSLDLNAADLAISPELREAARVFRAQAAAGLPMPNTRAAAETVWPALIDMQSGVLRRLLTPAQAVENADATLRARLDQP